MIDRNLLRQSPEVVRQSLEKRQENPELIEKILASDRRWREAVKQIESLRAERNALSAHGKPTGAKLKRAKLIADKLRRLTAEVRSLERKLEQQWLDLPNLVAEDVPPGGEESNRVIRQVGQPSLRAGRPHHELMMALGWLDLKTAATYSGSRFRYLQGRGAWAHLQLMLQALRFAVQNGFTLVIPPVLTREITLERAGFFPKSKDDIFALEKDNLYLAGTSEQTLLALAADRVFSSEELPRHWVGFSTCFRREAGSYGRDVEGMFRQHQFDKVELVVITTAEESAGELERLVRLEEQFVTSFKLPYQSVLTGAADLSPAAAKKIDLESYFPSQGRYRETHSASNCTDYQARRFNIKYRSSGKIQFAHTLNATLATERLMLAIIENSQRPDGSVALPRSLRL